MALIVGIGVVALAIGVALAFFVSRGSEKPSRTLWLSLSLLAVVFVGFVVIWLAGINYAWPVGWILAVALVAGGAVGLFVLIGMDIKWRPLRVVALLGVVLMAWVMFGNLNAWDIGTVYTKPLAVKRAAQIAKAQGFTALLPPGEEIGHGYGSWAVNADPDGLGVGYAHFDLKESKATGGTAEDLRKLVAPGASPTGVDPILAGGTVTTMTVQGQQAYAVEYTWHMLEDEGGKGGGKGGPPTRTPGVDTTTKSFSNAFLVFELDGTQVRLGSETGVTMPGGTFEPSQSSLDELVKIAESMEPAR